MAIINPDGLIIIIIIIMGIKWSEIFFELGRDYNFYCSRFC